jgi:hypothetical protein
MVDLQQAGAGCRGAIGEIKFIDMGGLVGVPGGQRDAVMRRSRG